MHDGHPVTNDKTFQDEPVRTVRRHWVCPKDVCGGEMLCTGRGMTTTMQTDWLHRCDRCGHEDWASASYPRIVHVSDTP